ncbi:hypothetical protein D3C86_925070 [compost metagenome]
MLGHRALHHAQAAASRDTIEHPHRVVAAQPRPVGARQRAQPALHLELHARLVQPYKFQFMPRLVGDGCLPPRRVGLVGIQRVLHPPHAVAAQVGGVGRAVAQQRVGLAAGQVVRLARGEHLHAQAGVLAVESGQQGDQQEAGPLIGVDPHRAHQLLGRIGLAGDLVGGLLHLLGQREHPLPQLGGNAAGGRALHHLPAQALFQRIQPARQRGRAHPRRLRSLAQRAAAHDGQQHHQVVPRKVFHICNGRLRYWWFCSIFETYTMAAGRATSVDRRPLASPRSALLSARPCRRRTSGVAS